MNQRARFLIEDLKLEPHPEGEYRLVSCCVGPGFEYTDFALAADHPEVAAAIRAQGAGFPRLL
jgi:predicted cupin superfamily sugar epimerase